MAERLHPCDDEASTPLLSTPLSLSTITPDHLPPRPTTPTLTVTPPFSEASLSTTSLPQPHINTTSITNSLQTAATSSLPSSSTCTNTTYCLSSPVTCSTSLPCTVTVSAGISQSLSDVSISSTMSSNSPSATPLLVPMSSSFAPVIYLRQNTPETTPVASPAASPTIPCKPFPEPSLPSDPAPGTATTTHLQHDPLTTPPNNCDSSFIPPAPSTDPTDSSDPLDTETGDDDGDDEEASKSVGCVGGLTRRVTHRPSLLTPAPEQHQRRASLLSTLSVSPSTGRRPSLVSLLSVTPSLAARRFSFSIGAHARVGCCCPVPAAAVGSLTCTTADQLSYRHYRCLILYKTPL